MSKFKIEIEKEKHSDYYTLLVTHNGYQWSGIRIESTEEMRQIAKKLIERAKNDDKNKS